MDATETDPSLIQDRGQMLSLDRSSTRLRRGAWLLTAAVACGAVCGCGALVPGGRTRSGKDKQLQAALAKDSFPTAAEAGLASSDK